LLKSIFHTTERLYQSLFVGIAVFMFGEITIELQVLAIILSIDYISGLLKSGILLYIYSLVHNFYACLFHKKRYVPFITLSSEVGHKGLLKKTGMLVAVMTIHLIDVVLGTADVFKTIIVWAFIANEFISIMENLQECGVEIDPQLIAQIKLLLKK